MGFPSSALLSTNSPTPVTPVIKIHWFHQFILKIFVVCCQFQNIDNSRLKHAFGAITFTHRFRLECFAVYTSSPLLPPGTQDSLHSGAGFSFYGRTFTCKNSTTSWRTEETCKKAQDLLCKLSMILDKSFQQN